MLRILTLLFGLASGTLAATPPIPARIPATANPAVSVWLSASSAVGNSEDINRDLLPTGAALSFADSHRAMFSTTHPELARQPFGILDVSSCTDFQMFADSARALPDNTFEELLRGSRGIFLGAIEVSEPGFFDGGTASLLQIRPTRWFRKDRRLGRFKRFLVPYPVARFHIGPNLFCGGAPEHRVPAVGARILVFVVEEAITEYLPLLVTAPKELIFDSAGKTVSIVPRLMHDPTLQAIAGFSSLVEMLPEFARTRRFAPEPSVPVVAPPSASTASSAAVRGCTTCGHTRLILDLNGDGIQTTSLASPVQFDFNGHGRPVATAWTCGWTDEAFLWLDRNHNGKVDSGLELFGRSIPLHDSSRATDGFGALAEWDRTEFGGNGDGRITTGDSVWRHLRLWIDRNHDGISQANEISRLQDFNIVALELGHTLGTEMDGNGNYHFLEGFYTKLIRLPGGRHGFAKLSMQDVAFQAASP